MHLKAPCDGGLFFVAATDLGNDLLVFCHHEFDPTVFADDRFTQDAAVDLQDRSGQSGGLRLSIDFADDGELLQTVQPISNHQQMAVLSQPDLLLFITWQDAFNEAPVIAGMVPDLHVAQFMDNDKIDHLRRGHDHPPGEGQAVIR